VSALPSPCWGFSLAAAVAAFHFKPNVQCHDPKNQIAPTFGRLCEQFCSVQSVVDYWNDHGQGNVVLPHIHKIKQIAECL
jgi:hypothetical protein